jgi:cytochrome P450
MAAVLQDPEVLPWLQVELDGLSWPPPEHADVPRLSALVQEVMRLNPPVTRLFRRTNRELVLDGVLVPAGRVVQVDLAASSRYSASADGRAKGDDLEQFRPERHLSVASALTLLPFGGGDRVCLGKALAELEIRLMTVGLLRQLTLKLQPHQDVNLQPITSLAPKDGLLVRAAHKARS